MVQPYLLYYTNTYVETKLAFRKQLLNEGDLILGIGILHQ